MTTNEEFFPNRFRVSETMGAIEDAFCKFLCSGSVREIEIVYIIASVSALRYVGLCPNARLAMKDILTSFMEKAEKEIFEDGADVLDFLCKVIDGSKHVIVKPLPE